MKKLIITFIGVLILFLPSCKKSQDNNNSGPSPYEGTWQFKFFYDSDDGLHVYDAIRDDGKIEISTKGDFSIFLWFYESNYGGAVIYGHVDSDGIVKQTSGDNLGFSGSIQSGIGTGIYHYGSKKNTSWLAEKIHL